MVKVWVVQGRGYNQKDCPTKKRWFLDRTKAYQYADELRSKKIQCHKFIEVSTISWQYRTGVRVRIQYRLYCSGIEQW